MLTLIKISALTLTIFFILLLTIGISFETESEIQHAVIINQPTSLVWRKLIAMEGWEEWRGEIKHLENRNTGKIQIASAFICYPSDDLAESFEEEITSLVDNRKIEIIRKTKTGQSVLLNYRTEFLLKSLKDGTTEVNWISRYRSATIMGRLYNFLYFNRYQHSMMNHDLNKLKEIMERV